MSRAESKHWYETLMTGADIEPDISVARSTLQCSSRQTISDKEVIHSFIVTIQVQVRVQSSSPKSESKVQVQSPSQESKSKV